jgi:hypothetical protein
MESCLAKVRACEYSYHSFDASALMFDLVRSRALAGKILLSISCWKVSSMNDFTADIMAQFLTLAVSRTTVKRHGDEQHAHTDMLSP